MAEHSSTLLSPVAPRHWIIACGYLEKQQDGFIRSGWTRRFFVLTPWQLVYFRRTTDADAEAAATLNDKSAGAVPPLTALFGEWRGQIAVEEIHSSRVRRHQDEGARAAETTHELHLTCSAGAWRGGKLVLRMCAEERAAVAAEAEEAAVTDSSLDDTPST